MRDHCLASVTILALSMLLPGFSACTAPIAAEAIAEGDPGPAPVRSEAIPGWIHQPEADPLPPDPDAAPHFELVVRHDPETADFLCPYAVQAHNFPAIAADQQTVVTLTESWSAGGEGEDAALRLDWRRLDTPTRSQVVFDRGVDAPWDDPKSCDESIARVREQVATANAALGERRWRSLDDLALEFPEARWFDDDPESPELAAADRPIEMVYRGGDVVARVRGVKVLHRIPRPDLIQPDDFCDSSPHLIAAKVDRRTGLTALEYTYASGACLCDDNTYTTLVRLPTDLVETA